MRKLLFGLFAIFLMASCSGNSSSEKSREDTASIADSIAQVETAKAEVEQARLDSIRQDSIAKIEESSKASAQYDDLLNQYEAAVKQYQKFVRNFNGNYSKQPSYTTKCNNLYSKLNKVKNQLSPEQKKKFKSLKSKYDQAYYSIQG